MRLILVPLLALTLGGCLAKTALDVATLPVKAAGKGIDWATTSQDEADRNRGRKMRKQEERQRKEQRRSEKEQRERERETAENY